MKTHLRTLIQRYVDSDSLQSAITYSLKLLVLTQEPEDVLVVAKLLFADSQYNRVISLLDSYSLLDEFNLDVKTDVPISVMLRCRVLAAQCNFHLQDYKGAIIVLEEEDIAFKQLITAVAVAGVDAVASISTACLIRSKAYDKLENRQFAIKWLKEALKRDVTCIEAFDLLVDQRMLSSEEEAKTFSNMVFSDEQQWLAQYYKMKIDQYDHSLESLESSTLGFGLENDLSVTSALAIHHFSRREYKESLDISTNVLISDQFYFPIIPTHLINLFLLNHQADLFLISSQLMESYPHQAISWFALGLFSLSSRNFDEARKFFNKATSIDVHFAPAWMGYGYSFSLQEETEQAISAYRTAARLFPGSHLPLLCIGMQYSFSQNWVLASSFIDESLKFCSFDPLIFNEYGVVSFNEEDYAKAADYFVRAISLVSDAALPNWEATFFNLGHCFRKLEKYDDAVSMYMNALSILPRNASIYTAIGVTMHLQWKLGEAISYYHKALGVDPSNTFTSDMLSNAIDDWAANTDVEINV